jgi:hypothetical protein
MAYEQERANEPVLELPCKNAEIGDHLIPIANSAPVLIRWTALLTTID